MFKVIKDGVEYTSAGVMIINDSKILASSPLNIHVYFGNTKLYYLRECTLRISVGGKVANVGGHEPLKLNGKVTVLPPLEYSNINGVIYYEDEVNY
jgi:hypothetical protein